METCFIDAGNSYFKTARYSPGTGWSQTVFGYDDGAVSIVEADRVFGVSVVPHRAANIQRRFRVPVQWINRSQLPAGLIDYKTPETLGLDRVVAAYGAFLLSGKKNVVLIDAGSAVTIDYIDRTGIFRGGIIAPGIGAFEEGMRVKTPRLPAVERTLPGGFPGKSTAECLQWGLSGGFGAMLNGFLARFESQFPVDLVVISGGDGRWLEPLLTSKSPRILEPFAVFEGLREIFTPGP